MITEINNWVVVGGRLDGWVDGYMAGWLAVYGWTSGQCDSAASAYPLLLSTGVTDRLTDLLQEPLHLLAGLLQRNLI